MGRKSNGQIPSKHCEMNTILNNKPESADGGFRDTSSSFSVNADDLDLHSSMVQSSKIYPRNDI